MSPLKRFTFFLWYFGNFKVPLIGHMRPKLIALSDEQIIVRIRLNRRSKNHLNSMYFGALAIGADLAGGLHAFYHAHTADLKIAMAFKSFQANFLKRPERDVFFVCNSGEKVKALLQESKMDKERKNTMIPVEAFIYNNDKEEKVAEFVLELSVKVI